MRHEEKQGDFNNEMVEEVKNNRKVVEKFVRDGDDHNKIKTITIEYGKLSHNPMGGIDVPGFVNGNKKLSFEYNIDKDNDETSKTYGKIVATGGTESPEFDEFVNGGK